MLGRDLPDAHRCPVPTGGSRHARLSQTYVCSHDFHALCVDPCDYRITAAISASPAAVLRGARFPSVERPRRPAHVMPDTVSRKKAGRDGARKASSAEEVNDRSASPPGGERGKQTAARADAGASEPAGASTWRRKRTWDVTVLREGVRRDPLPFAVAPGLPAVLLATALALAA